MVLGTLAAGEMVHMVEDLVAVVLTPEKANNPVDLMVTVTTIF